MKRYRFFDISDNQKWYLMRPTHIDGPTEFCIDLASAGLFTEAEWLAWGNARYEREAAPAASAPMLPGLEG